MQAQPIRCLLVTFIGLCMSSICLAQDLPESEITATYAVQNGSNLSYVPDALLTEGNNTHHVETATVGFSVRTKQGMQRLMLDGSLVNRSFESTQTVNAVTSNYNLLWQWAATPRWTGELGASRRESFDTLVSSPFQGQANSVLTNDSHFDVAWQVDGPWRLIAGVAQARTATTRSAPSDQNTRSANAGIRYVSGTGSSLTFKQISTDGEFSSSSTSVRSDITQRDSDIRFHLVISDGSTADAYTTYSENSRNHPSTGGKQGFDGWNAGGSLTWSFGGLSTLQIDLAHTLAATGLDSPLFSETDRVTVGPVWQIGSKTALTLHHTWAQQTFGGYSSNALLRLDKLRVTALGFAWKPYKHWSLNAGLQHLSRESNDLYAVVATNAATISAHISY